MVSVSFLLFKPKKEKEEKKKKIKKLETKNLKV